MALGEVAKVSITMGTACAPSVTGFAVHNFTALLATSSCFLQKAQSATNAGQHLFEATLATLGAAQVTISNRLAGATLGAGTIALYAT